MTDTVTTRITLPGPVHREVKAEAARRGLRVDEALGMCVAFICGLTTPLVWLTNLCQVEADVAAWLDKPNPVS